MGQATCRVTPDMEAAIEDAAAEVGLFRSDIIRRAILHYFDTNPDEIRAFEGRPMPGGMKRINAPNKARKETPAFDPLRDL